jgi:hypothetical protein
MGCKSKHEKAQEKMSGLLDQFADILTGIKSNTDFVDAKPKLERLGAQMKDVRNEIKALPTPSADEQKKLDKEFDTQTKASSERIQKELHRLDNLGVSPLEVIGAMHIDPTEFMGG